MKRGSQHEYFSSLMREGKIVYCHGVLFRWWNKKSGWLQSPTVIGASSNTPYVKTSARVDGKIIAANVHAVIWDFFTGGNLSQTEPLDLNHIDGIKTNNLFENLELVTKSRNIEHAYELSLIKKQFGEDNHSTTLTTAQVQEIQAMDFNAPLGPVAKRYGVNKTTICLIRARKSRSSEAIGDSVVVPRKQRTRDSAGRITWVSVEQENPISMTQGDRQDAAAGKS